MSIRSSYLDDDAAQRALPRAARGVPRSRGARRGACAHLRSLLDLPRPRVRGRGARRFPDARARHAPHRVRARQGPRRARAAQLLHAPRRRGVPRAQRQREQLPVLLPRLDLRERRAPDRRAERRGLRPGLLAREARPARGAAARELPRLLLRELRSRDRAAARVPGRRARVSRPDRRPVRARDGDPRRHAVLRDQRQLEAAGREQLRRLSRADHPRPLHEVPDLERRGRAAGRRDRRTARAISATDTPASSTRRPGAGRSRTGCRRSASPLRRRSRRSAPGSRSVSARSARIGSRRRAAISASSRTS